MRRGSRLSFSQSGGQAGRNDHGRVSLMREVPAGAVALFGKPSIKEESMRPTPFLISAAIMSLSVAACSQGHDDANAPSAVTNAEANATPSANPASTDLSTTDVTKAPNFVTLAASSDMFEVQSSKIALQRSTNPDVKRFAQMMIDAHTKTTAALKGLIAGQSNLSPPTALSADLQSKLDALGSVSPADFDKTYLNDQIDGHQSALNVMQRYAKDGDLEPLKQFAAHTAPTVQQHLDKAKAILDALNKATTNAASNAP
jgi:putative membrane protein